MILYSVVWCIYLSPGLLPGCPMGGWHVRSLGAATRVDVIALQPTGRIRLHPLNLRASGLSPATSELLVSPCNGAILPCRFQESSRHARSYLGWARHRPRKKNVTFAVDHRQQHPESVAKFTALLRRDRLGLARGRSPANLAIHRIGTRSTCSTSDSPGDTPGKQTAAGCGKKQEVRTPLKGSKAGDGGRKTGT